MEGKEMREPELIVSNTNTVTDASVLELKPKKKKRHSSKVLTTEISQKEKIEEKLRNSSWFKQQQTWRKFIKSQRKQLRSLQPTVDDKAFALKVNTLYDPDLLKATFGNLKRIFEVKAGFVKTLHEVNINPGKTDTFSFHHSVAQSSNYEERKSVAKSIERDNKTLLKSFKNPQVRVTTVKQYAEEWKKHENLVESYSQYPLWWKVQEQEESVEIGHPPFHYEQHITEKSAKYPDKRPRVSLEISIKKVGVVGKMTAVLYSDYVPMTVKNFLAFCDPKGSLTYKGNLFYFIFPNYYCQTGDVVENMGFGGTSIYGPYFGNEDSTLKHRERGILTMYQKLPNRNDSRFLITFRHLESLDGKNVVFGKIVKGLHVLEAIEGVGSEKSGRPRVEIYISDCEEI